MRILIAGNGKVGETLVAELSAEGYDLTVIDTDSSVLERVSEKYDVMTLLGNCASMKTLRDADVEGADLLIAATGSDELNLLCCVTAHKMNPHLHTIARLRNPEYEEQAYSMKDEFALSLVFNPEKQTAIEIDRLLKYPAFLKRDAFARGRVEIVELKIDGDSRLCGVSLFDMYKIIKCKVLVCTVLRDGVAMIPRGNFTLLEGDRIFVTASSGDLALLLKNLGITKHKIKNVMLAGGGTVAYYLARLLRSGRIGVRILEQDEERCRKLAELLPDVDVIQGDAANRAVLDSEQLSNFDALVSLTGIDEMNLIISLYGTSCGMPKVITKLGRMDDTALIESLSVGSVVIPRKLCCSNILRYVRALHNQTGAALTIHSIAEDQAEAIEFPVDESTLHRGIPLKDIKIKKNVIVACITRRNKVEIAGGDSCLEAGDSVIVVVSGGDVVLHLNDIFE